MSLTEALELALPGLLQCDLGWKVPDSQSYSQAAQSAGVGRIAVGMLWPDRHGDLE